MVIRWAEERKLCVASHLSQMPATDEAMHFIFNPWKNCKSAPAHFPTPNEDLATRATGR